MTSFVAEGPRGKARKFKYSMLCHISVCLWRRPLNLFCFHFPVWRMGIKSSPWIVLLNLSINALWFQTSSKRVQCQVNNNRNWLTIIFMCVHVCLTEEYSQVGMNFCVFWWICKEKDSLQLTAAVKIQEMQIYKPVIRCHLLVHGEKEKVNSP